MGGVGGVEDLLAVVSDRGGGAVMDLTPGTAVGWVNNAGGDWSRYAAALANEAITNPAE